jgi:ABC-type multidrug transport system fused ATPase/permease subunit
MITNQEIRLFWHYLRSYKLQIAKISVLAIFCAFFEAINLGALVPLLQIMSGSVDPGGTLWGLLKSVFQVIGIELNFINLVVVMGILFLIGQVLLYIKKRMQASLWFTFSADLKKGIFTRLLKTDIRYHYSEKSGKFIDILNRQAEYASTSIFAVTEILTYIFFIIVYIAILLYISPELTAICLIISFLSLYLLNTIIKKSKQLGLQSNETNIHMNEFVTERLGLIKLVKIFSTEDEETRKFASITDRYIKNNSAFLMNGVKIETIFQIIIFGIALFILYTSMLILKIPLAMLLVFIFILIRLTDPLRQLNAKRHEIAGQLASLEKIDETIQNTTQSETIRTGTVPFEKLHDRIELKNIWFSYIAATPVIQDVTFTINKYEMVALVGASGGGKSTIVDLIIRLMEPDSGEIVIDGTNIKQFDLQKYHKKIGFVSQESFLFNDSVINNIAYGSDVVSQERAEQAAKIANAHDFITQLPEGYTTQLGERGVKISGGQKQRIALARALYKEPEILILDEATSSLDSESEKIIQESIANIKNKFTIIVIAHRLSTIENADTIIVIENGRIAETGKSADLLDKNGIFTKYYRLQFQSNGRDPVHDA